ncbi:amidohydrolase [Staphylococcus simiae]|uniref:M20 metallopeptidase family protein n=1 Tax=Staphylococcus simiae TaxID=308354 RepID=UPI001A9571E2|nr:amidohydrolase [Staphylococcus simiae]MBO1198700.1 amidohydrolase [Staphylococcus simiae]MBO1200952.1 amidohydrolase [Staphylococcus simiae]MBO1203203.1 amidohydrolase [Staphylococcus simiae]MBO1210689.1 amidohydrolase [Staphylococcus simiae]MBO1229290.1 amidohydrolase [Staphylococcus simiae]
MTNLRETVFKKIEDKQQRIIELRRHLHSHPELSFEEENTSQFIKDFYKDKDVKMHTDLNGQHGLVVEINGGQPGNTIALRADFDALPIKEDTGLEFASQHEGVMHACGHDAHTAYLLGVAEALIEVKEDLPGTVKIIHQHAEEVPPGGAQDILASGVLDDVDEVYGIHFFPNLDVGTIFVHQGEAFAGRSNFDMHIQGKGGHAAMPQNTNDALVAGAYFVTEAQTVVSRRIDPLESAVVSISAFEAPGGYNVIQDNVTLRGTVRYMNEDLKETLYNEINNIAQGLETTFNVKVNLDYKYDYPVLYNNDKQTDAVQQILEQAQGSYVTDVVDLGPITGSEDFAYYLTDKPGTFIVVGAKPVDHEVYPLHHPKMVLNEDGFQVAAKAIADIALNRLTAEI